MVAITQTVALVIAALVSAYAVASSEVSGRRAAREARVQRLMDAVLALAEVAAREDPALVEVARRRLRAELQVTGIEGFWGVELMTRQPIEMDGIVRQSEAAMIEIAAAFDQLAPRPLIGSLLGHRRVRPKGRVALIGR